MRRHRIAVSVASLLCLLASAGCGGYDSAREAYQESGHERAAADRQLRSATAELSLPRLPTPTDGSDASCHAIPPRAVFSSHTVSCSAKRWVAYRVSTADAAPDSLWTAERSAVRMAVAHLDRAGWDRAEWSAQLPQSLENRTYNPYPVNNGAAGNDDVSVRLHLLDRRWHEPSEAYDEALRFAKILEDGKAGALVVVVFHTTYLGSSCDDCADHEPTAWPT